MTFISQGTRIPDKTYIFIDGGYLRHVGWPAHLFDVRFLKESSQLRVPHPLRFSKGGIHAVHPLWFPKKLL
jgi:hypothetical protein